MDEKSVSQLESRIYKGATDGSVIRLGGGGINFIQVPAGMEGSELSFKVCFNDGTKWFWLLDETGKKITHSTRWPAQPIPAQEAQQLIPTPVIVPVPMMASLAKGVQFLIVVSNRAEVKDQVIILYQVSG